LNDVVPPQSAQVGPGYLHIVHLDVDFVDTTEPQSLDIRFRVDPPAPNVQVKDGVPTGGEFEDREGAKVVKSSDITNLENRPVRVWVGSTEQDALTLSVSVGLQSWSQPDRGTTSLAASPMCAGSIRIPIAPPQLNPVSWERSSVPLRVSEVFVDQTRMGPVPVHERRLIRLGEGQVPSIELGPGGRATLLWLATPDPGSSHCPLPVQATHHFVWWNGGLPPQSPLLASCPLPDPYTTSADHDDRWILGGTSLEGRWHGSVKATNDWERTPPPGFVPAANVISLSQGVDPRDLPAHDCQGLF
jgi:hypothetical protein